VPEHLADVDRRLQGGRLRPRHRRDAGHRPGRRRDRRPRRRVALRDDPGVRRRLPAREDRHARLRRRRRDQQVRAARRRGRAPRRAPPAGAQPRGVRDPVGGHAGLRHQSPPASTTTASPPSTSTCAGCSAARPAAVRRARPGPGRHQGLDRPDERRPAAAGALPRRDRRDGPRLPRPHRRAGRPSPAAPAPARDARAARPTSGARERRRGARAELGRAREGARADVDGRCSTSGPAVARPTRGDEHVYRSATARSAAADPRDAVGHEGPPRRAAPHDDHGDLCVPAPRTCPGASRSPPGCSRSSARARRRPGCSPARATRLPHQPPLPPALRGPARHPAVDRVRLGHALRPRPGRAARHLRQGRHLRRVDRHPRRHEGPLRRASTCATRRPRCR
jgi:hypothetical protein